MTLETYRILVVIHSHTHTHIYAYTNTHVVSEPVRLAKPLTGEQRGESKISILIVSL